MKTSIRTIAFALLMFGALSAASCGGGGGSAPQVEGASSWDSMVWDQGSWK